MGRIRIVHSKETDKRIATHVTAVKKYRVYDSEEDRYIRLSEKDAITFSNLVQMVEKDKINEDN